MNDMTGRELQIGDKVAYIFVPYGKAVPEHGGTGIVTKIDEDRPMPIQVNYGEKKSRCLPHKLVILERK